MDPAEWQAAGLYDPAAPGAPERLELLTLLAGLGATVEDMVEAGDDLPGLASVILLRPGRPELTAAALAERAGVPEARAVRLWRALGFPDPGPGAAAFSAADVELLRLVVAADDLFGEAATMQLARLIGSAAARIADAFVSSFLVNLELPLHGEADPVLAVARGNERAARFYPAFVPAFDTVLRRHILAARRSILALDRAIPGVETRRLAVGFADVADSTALLGRLAPADAAGVLAAFEGHAADIVTERGGRVVKLIGDEVMFTALDDGDACAIGVALVAAGAGGSRFPPVRVGIAGGPVMTRDGDCYGPVVNLAARAVKTAAPGEVLVDGAVRTGAADRFRFGPAAEHRLKGFDAPVALYALAGPASGAAAAPG